MYRTTLTCCLALLCASVANAATKHYQGYTFQADVVAQHGPTLTEHRDNSRPTLYVAEGDEYSVVLHNPLPVRVAVALSLDGLNSIDGKRTKPSDASKWIIEPNSSVTIRGWQTGSEKLRRFVFTHQDDSYAEWKQNRDNTDYTRNLGVIGVAWFWSSAELHDALNPPQPFAYDDARDEAAPAAKGAGSSPQSEAARAPSRSALGASAANADRSAQAAPECEAKKKCESRAGTGMGRSEGNAVTRVDFEFDTGMYTNKDCLAIYYEFAQPKPNPKPFMDNDDEGYAPEMQSSTTTHPHWWR